MAVRDCETSARSAPKTRISLALQRNRGLRHTFNPFSTSGRCSSNRTTGESHRKSATASRRPCVNLTREFSGSPANSPAETPANRPKGVGREDMRFKNFLVDNATRRSRFGFIDVGSPSARWTDPHRTGAAWMTACAKAGSRYASRMYSTRPSRPSAAKRTSFSAGARRRGRAAVLNVKCRAAASGLKLRSAVISFRTPTFSETDHLPCSSVIEDDMYNVEILGSS